MMRTLRTFVVLVLINIICISCGDMRRRADEKIDRLMKKTESLDSLISEELDKVLVLDSIINKGSEKARELDSLVDKSASRLDSMVNRVINHVIR